jgi:hypothetical protein
MSFAKKTLIATLFTITLSSIPAFADAPSYVRINNISYAGSGCPAGTVAENISADKKAFVLLFDSYIAEIGPGISVREARKNCQISIDLNYPRGWSFALMGLEYRGFANLDTGVEAVQRTSHYYAGQGGAANFSSTFRGPMSYDFQINDNLAATALLWSPCNAQRALNINTQIRLDNSRNPRGSGLITVDRINTVMSHRYGLVWKRCS